LLLDGDTATSVRALLPGRVIVRSDADLVGVDPLRWEHEATKQFLGLVRRESPMVVVLSTRLSDRYSTMPTGLAIAGMKDGPKLIVVTPESTPARRQQAYDHGVSGLVEVSACGEADLAPTIAAHVLYSAAHRVGRARRLPLAMLGARLQGIAGSPLAKTALLLATAAAVQR
jgi:hypothetical protein